MVIINDKINKFNTQDSYSASSLVHGEITLDEIALRVEAKLDRRLAGLAIFHPKVIAGQTIRPEIDLRAKEFFIKFDRIKDQILAADELTSYKLAIGCCSSNRDFERFYDETYDPRKPLSTDFSCVIEVQKIGEELTAIRIARKTLIWFSNSEFVRDVVYGS